MPPLDRTVRAASVQKPAEKALASRSSNGSRRCERHPRPLSHRGTEHDRQLEQEDCAEARCGDDGEPPAV